MTNMELVLNMLAETSSTEISKSKSERGIDNAKDSVIKGGNIAKIAKEQLEKETGKNIITAKNAREIKKITIKSFKILKMWYNSIDKKEEEINYGYKQKSSISRNRICRDEYGICHDEPRRSR